MMILNILFTFIYAYIMNYMIMFLVFNLEKVLAQTPLPELCPREMVDVSEPKIISPYLVLPSTI